MIERTFSAQRLNEVLNHPDVFRWVAAPGIDRLDFTVIASDPRNVVLMTDQGGFVFVPRGNQVYEVHTQFLPSGARIALKAAKHAAAFMFSHTDCTVISTYVPVGNERARRLTLAMGFTPLGLSGTWIYPSGEQAELEWFELTKGNWLCQQQQS